MFGLFQKKIGPIFLKEDSDAEKFIEKMTELSTQAEGQLKNEIEKQIKLAHYGLLGEKNIMFELRNSDMDMIILHDLYLEHEDLQAQIDFIVITRKRTYIIECKNLFGNIEIDNQGNFIRSYELFGKRIKEGIYSPITQNERHRLVIKKLRAQEKNPILKIAFEKYFDDNYKSLIVLANPKTILNAKFAKKEHKNQVIRTDTLLSQLKQLDKEVDNVSLSEKEMYALAEFYLTHNISDRSDYSKKYEEMLAIVEHTKADNQEIASTTEESIANTSTLEKKICPRCGSELVLRTAKKGDNAGQQFYGCSKFPKCFYTLNLTEEKTK